MIMYLCLHLQGHTGGIYSLVVDPGEEREQEVGYGDLVITGSLDCTARSYDFVSGKLLLVTSSTGALSVCLLLTACWCCTGACCV